MTDSSDEELFYFHVRNGFGFAEDSEGVRLAGRDQAREHAVKAARSLISADAETGCIDLRGEIQVADHSRDVILILKFEEAVEIVPNESA